MHNPHKIALTGYLGIVFSLLIQPVFSTEIFRMIDSSGNVTYSDKAVDGAKQINLSSSTFRHQHQVTKVYDGDTILLKNGKRVRLLGINTPEVKSRYRTAEPGGQAAKVWLEEQLQGQKIYLEYDLEKQDKYGRLLAHVFLTDGSHINLELIKQGLAFVSIIPPNIRHASQFESAQKQAESDQIGIWKMQRYQIRELSEITSNNDGWQRVTGVLQTIRPKRKYTYLDFNDQINIRIANDALKYFPDLTHYLDKTVEIRGWVSKRYEKYSIHIRHPSALLLR